jgi:hypothetical protein
LRIVSAVSGPGVTMTTIDTPRNVRNEPSMRSITSGVIAAPAVLS